MSFPRYEKYKDSGVDALGTVPGHWNVTQLRHQLESTSEAIKIGPFGSELKLESLIPSGFKVYGQENVISQDFSAGSRFIGDIRYNELRAYSIRSGDVLVSMMGSAGHCAVVPEFAVPGILDSHLLRLRFQSSVLPSFLARIINESDYVDSQLIAAGRGSIMQGLNSAVMKAIFLAIPPLGEQRTIASFLDRETGKIDALIAEHERLIVLLMEKRQAVISRAVTKGLNPNAPMKNSGAEWLGEVPARWEMRRLKHISPSQTVGIVVNPSEYIADEGAPFIYGGDIHEGWIDIHGARRISQSGNERHTKSRLNKGDLLTVRVGAPGVTAVVPDELEGGNCASVMIVRKASTFHSDWLCYAMNSRVVRFQVEVVQYGAAQEQFNISHAVNFWIPTPPPQVQRAIAEFLHGETERIDGLVAEAGRAISLLQERRTALISAAVTGKIDVRGQVQEVA